MTKFTNCSIIAPPEAPRRRRSRVGCSRRSCTRRSHKAPTSSYPPQLPPPTSLTQPNPNPRPNRLNPPPPPNSHQTPSDPRPRRPGGETGSCSRGSRVEHRRIRRGFGRPGARNARREPADSGGGEGRGARRRQREERRGGRGDRGEGGGGGGVEMRTLMRRMRCVIRGIKSVLWGGFFRFCLLCVFVV